jgi:DNA-3-methyladenine glycosylase I
MHYCDIAPGHPIHGPYHDTEYGFPVTDDRILFERLTLEAFQAGLSWEIILKKREGLRAAFYDYDLKKIAAMTETDVERLRENSAIIRNRLKILATIHNAKQVIAFQHSSGSFYHWLTDQPWSDLEEWVKCMRKHFKFMGPEIVGEFLMSIGLLPGAHKEMCPVYQKLQQ